MYQFRLIGQELNTNYDFVYVNKFKSPKEHYFATYNEFYTRTNGLRIRRCMKCDGIEFEYDGGLYNTYCVFCREGNDSPWIWEPYEPIRWKYYVSF